MGPHPHLPCGRGLTLPPPLPRARSSLCRDTIELQVPPPPKTHQEAVVLVPHEDQAQPGHHLQVAAAVLDEDPGPAERQLDSVETGLS